MPIDRAHELRGGETRVRLRAALGVPGLGGVGRFRIMGSYTVVLEDGEGRVLLRSGPLGGQLACRATIVAMRMSALLDDRFCRDRTDAGGYLYALLGYRGQPIASSPVYSTAEDCQRAITRVRACLPTARVEQAELMTVPLETAEPDSTIPRRPLGA
jgi:uncharacterized protein YegP (UPF0339 family)